MLGIVIGVGAVIVMVAIGEGAQKDIEDRIDNPEGFDHEAAFQKAWSGDPFDNAEWTKEYGDGKTYVAA